MRWVVLVLAAVALTGCETTAEKSARLEKVALARAKPTDSSKGLAVTRPSRIVKVRVASVVHDREGTAAAVTLRNTSGEAQYDVPLAITVHGAGGSSIYTNATQGLAKSLTSAPAIPPHGEITWVDDQVQGSGSATGVSATAGEGTAVTGTAPKLQVSSEPPVMEPGGGESVAGKVRNVSRVGQRELVVYAVSRRGGRIVAAGRAVIASLPVGAVSPFQIYLVGEPKSATLSLSAPARTVG